MSAATIYPPAASLAGIAVSAIQGARDAQRLQIAIRTGCAPADALLEGLEQIRATDDAGRLRGFCRELQKTLERAA